MLDTLVTGPLVVPRLRPGPVVPLLSASFVGPAPPLPGREATASAARTWSLAAPGLLREPGQLVLVDEPVLVRVGPFQEAPHPLGQFILAQLPIAVLVESHHPRDQFPGVRPGRAALAERGEELVASELAVLVLVQGTERRGRVVDLLGRQFAVAVGVEGCEDRQRGDRPPGWASPSRPLRRDGSGQDGRTDHQAD